ncbi:MAG: rhomboid family intramembrane serine protease, partial [Anaerolineae bacterium]|nr:rhomboid family intramembrane serine protease [Anaerolineae bacterium]
PPPRSVRLARSRPVMTYALIAINVIIFVIRALSVDTNWSLLIWGANQPEQVFQGGEFYRLFTAMFLHAGIYTSSGGWAIANSAHLVFNMVMLYMVGLGIESIFGSVRFTVIYLLGGLTGSLLSALLGDYRSYSVGASGAVFAILGAEFIFLYRNRKITGAGGAARRRNLINLAFINLLFGLLSTASGSQMRIDNWGHIGGLLGGLILAWFLSPIYTHHDDPNDETVVVIEDANPLSSRLWMFVGLYAAGFIGVLLIGQSFVGR